MNFNLVGRNTNDISKAGFVVPWLHTCYDMRSWLWKYELALAFA